MDDDDEVGAWAVICGVSEDEDGGMTNALGAKSMAEMMEGRVPRILKAIHNIQAALAVEGISKDQKNPSLGYKFRGIDQVYKELSPLLGQFGVVITPTVVHREESGFQDKTDKLVVRTVVTVDYEFASIEDGSTKTVRMVGEAMDWGDKGTNKALSTAYKYMAFQTFCIGTRDGEDDTEMQTHEVVRSLNGVGSVMPACPHCRKSDAVILNKFGSETHACYKVKGGCGLKFTDLDEIFAGTES